MHIYIYTTYLANKYGQRWLVKYCYAAKKTAQRDDKCNWPGALGWALGAS
jgi:hypothetical protein